MLDVKVEKDWKVSSESCWLLVYKYTKMEAQHTGMYLLQTGLVKISNFFNE